MNSHLSVPPPGVTDVFRKVPGHRTQHEVIDQITFAIRAGVFAQGDRLPSLDELSSRLAVSRSVVVEAIRSLSTAGVIATQRGNKGGLTVLTSNIPVALLGLTANRFEKLPDLLEARRAVELRLALLCAERATPEDFDALETSVHRLIESRDAARPERRHWDHLFHYQMGRAARSEVLAYMQHQILEQLTVVLETYFTEDEDPSEVEALHRETLDCLLSGSPDSIKGAVDRHLAPLERLIEEPSSEGEEPSPAGQEPSPAREKPSPDNKKSSPGRQEPSFDPTTGTDNPRPSPRPRK